MFEDYLREIPKNPLLNNTADLGDLGTNTAALSNDGSTPLLNISTASISQDIQTLIQTLPSLDTPVLSGGSTTNLEHLIAFLQQKTESQQYKQKMMLLQNAYDVTSAKNANALAIMDDIFNLASQSNICTQTGIILGYMLAAQEAGMPVEKYLAEKKITITPQMQKLIDIAEAEFKNAPANASLSTIVGNILASAGEAAQTTFTQEDLDKYAAQISSELLDVHASGQEAREAHQGAVDAAESNRDSAETSKADAQTALDNAKTAEQNAETALQDAQNARLPLETQYKNAKTEHEKAKAAETAAKTTYNQAETDYNTANEALTQAKNDVSEAGKALQDFTDAHPQELDQDGNPIELSDDLKAEQKQLEQNLTDAQKAQNDAQKTVDEADKTRNTAKTNYENAQIVTTSMADEEKKAENNLKLQDQKINDAQTALNQAKEVTKTAQSTFDKCDKAKDEAELALLAATTAQHDAAMAAINQAFGEYVDACVALGLMEAEKRQEQERLEEQDAQKEQLAEDIEKYIKKMNLPIKTSAEQLAEVLTALLDSQAEFLDMMNKTEEEKKDIEREIYQKETI